MTKIFVFSDSHGEVDKMVDIISRDKPDMILHLGDYTSDCDELRDRFPKMDIRNVKGNCDRYSAKPELLVINEGGKKIFACHGHKYNVKEGYTNICFAALEKEADILLFGHTHKAYRDTHLGMEIMNPGSIGKSAKPSYGVIILDGSSLQMDICYV